MDTITRLVVSIDNPLLHGIGMLIQNPVFFSVLVLSALWIGERRPAKLFKVLCSLALALVLVTAIKHYMAVERPCIENDWCPDSYSFPSMHAAISFTLMTAFLNKKRYPYYLFFALFICFTRLNIGVHTFYDVAAALPIALLSYYITTVVFNRVSSNG